MNDSHIDTTTFELGEAKLALRDDLRFTVQGGRFGDKSYLVEDQANGHFFRLGEAEYTFISLLDGETTLATAVARTSSLVGRQAFNEEDAAGICKWLVDSGLAATRSSTSARRMDRRRREANSQQTVQKLNPISVRIPLFNPNRLVKRLTRYVGWVFSKPAGWLWLMVCGWAIAELCVNAESLSERNIEVFSRDNMFWLAVVWCVLKLGHELGHAVACRRFGGSVRKCGVLFLLMIPLPFVDVTSSWRFSNKYYRMIVSAAGMMVELFAAAVATLVWLRVDAGIVSQQAMNIMLAASINTILFNANPLMRFDGYHILADWLEIPNLAKYGQQHVMSVVRRLFFGIQSARLPWSGIRGRFIKIYGFAALIWKLLICLTLMIGASNLLPGFGFLLGAIAVVLWLALPAIQFLKYLVSKDQPDNPDRIRFAAIVTSGVLSIWALGVILPSPSVVTAPIVIDYQPKRIVRAESAGFVETIFVHPGQKVAADAVLIRLHNPDLELKRVELESQLLQTQLRAAKRQREHQVAAWQIEQETMTSLQKQQVELEQQIDRLTVVAPITGQVIARHLQELEGTYVRPGDELLSIGDRESMEAIALVTQEHGRHLQMSTGKRVQLRLDGDSSLSEGTIAEISPRLQTSPPHFAFAGIYGGPLTVVNREQLEDTSSVHESSLSLLEPMLSVSIDIDPMISSMLHSGQTGLAHLRVREDSMGSYLLNQASGWIVDQIQFNHGL